MSNATDCPVEMDMKMSMSILHRIITPILFGIVVLIGFFGNLLVMIVIISNNHMRNTTNILIMSLALADLLFIIFCVPMTALFYFFDSWVFGTVACILFHYFTYTTVYLSVYTLVLMSLDRYLAVVHAIESMNWRTKQNTIIAVLVTWIVICFGHVFYVWDVVVIESPIILLNSTDNATGCIKKQCLNSKFHPAKGSDLFTIQGRIFYTCFNVFGFFLPILVIIRLYVSLVKKLLFGRSAQLSQSEAAMSSKRRVTTMVVIVIIIFGSCWLPIHIVFVVQVWIGDFSYIWWRLIHISSQILAYMNSCMNPILYAFLSENFRQAFAKFLGITLKPRTRSNTARPTKTVVMNGSPSLLTAEQTPMRKILLETDLDDNELSDDIEEHPIQDVSVL